MAFRAYILIEAEVGHAKGVAEAVGALTHPSAKIAA